MELSRIRLRRYPPFFVFLVLGINYPTFVLFVYFFPQIHVFRKAINTKPVLSVMRIRDY